jgi:5-methylthioribose kinase
MDGLGLIDAEGVGTILADLGVVAPGERIRAEPLSGGISNIVLGVEWGSGRAVVKQSLPKLRVAADWSFDRGRIVNERRCMAYLGEILEDGAVPDVIAHDDERFLFVMTWAPDGGEVWKQALLDGRVDLSTAERVGTMLGRIHDRSSLDPRIAEDFGDITPLVQGRVDPYHRTAAALNPQVAAAVHAEEERLLATRRTLVLGDWSPKNLLAYPDRVVALDFEVAHHGDPAFDVAFMLTHLVLKRFHRPAAAPALRAAATAFLDAYASEAAGAAPTEAETAAELGCLLLARVDGKSPAEYLSQEERPRVRAAAYEILLDGDRPLAATLDRLFV